MANILDLKSPEGPRYVLPSYEGVTFPPFPRELSKAFRTPMSGKDIAANWEAILANPPQNYYGVPHAMVAQMNKAKTRPVRCLWPFFGSNTETAKQRLHDTLQDASQGILLRRWAIKFEDGWKKDVDPSARPRGRPKGKTAKVLNTTEAGLQGRIPPNTDVSNDAGGSGQQAKEKRPARREYSRVPEVTEDENGLCGEC